jgi:hypothetical protein
MSEDIPISIFLNPTEEKVEEKPIPETPEQALLDALTGKKDTEKKEAEKAVAEKLISLMPKKEDPALQEVAQAFQEVQSQISLKKASALGKDLVDVLNKSEQIASKEQREQGQKIEGEVKEKLDDIIQSLIDKVLKDNPSEERTEELEEIAVKMIRQFLQNDLFKLLRKQNDIQDGKYTYYSDEPIYNLFGGGGGGGDSADQEVIDDLQKQLAKCNTYLNVLEQIYKSDVINLSDSPYQISYATANVIVADATDGPINITLPPAMTNINRYFIVKKIDTTNNPVNIYVYDSNTEDIDGDTSRTITTVDSLGFFSDDGATWHGIGDPDARACYYFGEFIFDTWNDFDPQYEWRDFDQTTTWADIQGENVLVHERERLLL